MNKPFFNPVFDALTLDTVTADIAMTGTGLDTLVKYALLDPGLNQWTEDADIIDGASAAAQMNAIVIEAIKATGAANDGAITSTDVFAMSDWIAANRLSVWTVAHGDDENNVETGFHKIQSDGNAIHLFGDRMIDQVADGIYHLGFGYAKGRLTNEDGNANARVEEVAFWLNELLSDDLAAGTLANSAVTLEHAGTTGTGLDALVDMINEDVGLASRVSADEIKQGAAAADEMNAIIVEGIKALGLADDATLEPSEIYDLADWINANRLAPWLVAHGDDENDEETGFHLVQNDGGETRAFGRASINTIADAIYHLGFGYSGDRLINEDGNRNERVEDVTYWLNELLADDLAAGTLGSGNSAPVAGTTGTGLDSIVALISGEGELNRRIADQDIKDGASAANEMNEIIVEGIKATGIANDGKITRADVMDLSDWIAENRLAAWTVAHGDDEDDEETGFHLVQNDGAVERLYDQNAINTVADGLYHLGFGYNNGRLTNEDGNANATLSNVAFWLETLLTNDLADGSLANPAIDLYPQGTTGTAFDQITSLVTSDEGLTKRYTATELKDIATDVDALNKILVQAIAETGAANDGSLTAQDVVAIGNWIKNNASAEFRELRGDYDDKEGIVGLAWKGAVGELGNTNAVNKLALAIYSLGFETRHGGIRDEDGDWVGSLEDAASWLNVLLGDDLAAGTFFNADQASVDPTLFAQDAVVAVGAVNVTDANNYVVIDHENDLRLNEGTVAFSFVAEQADNGFQVMFAKDASGTNDGDMRAYLYEGVLHVKVSMDEKDHYLKVETPIVSGEAHDVAITFNDDGITLWLDGVREAYSDSVDYSMTNSSDVIVGANNGYQVVGGDEKISNHFQGDINGFAIYNRVLEMGEIGGLSKGTTASGTDVNDDIAGTDGQDALYGGLGRDVMLAGDGDDFVDGGYGADRIEGGAGNDVIDGGHGQDTINGGDGDDIILSTSDGREPVIGQLVYGSNGRVRGDDGSVDAQTLTIYPDQPIAANDILTGGAGADTFRFQWMINAKENIILKHVRSDGSINWRGVAGENDLLHDHWVDTIGDDIITDYSKAEGDRIEVAGHTLTFNGIEYRDIDGDGVDESIISYKSNQGNGGAHDQDRLGTITVYGDRVEQSDITQIPSMSVFYGIVENVADLAEAVTPLSIDEGTARDVPDGLVTVDADGPRGDVKSGPVAPAEAPIVAATRSNTGLDTILDWIETDPGLDDRIDNSEISQGSAAAAAMNAIIIEAIKATGAANDGVIDAGDAYDLATWISENRQAEWLVHHGDDEQGVETGFHLVQNDGAARDAYGRNSINTVADAIYHLGFGFKKDRLINEDGNNNERVESVATWLNDLLADDLAGDALKNPNAEAPVTGTTNTGLDQFIDIIQDDAELNRRIPDAEQQSGADAANTMNEIIVESIKKLGLANDGTFTAADVMALADEIKANHYNAWFVAHGDDENNAETGFHLVQNDGATTQMFGQNAVNTIADGLYHLGFGYKNGRLINEDGNGNASVESVAHWLNQVLADDMDALSNDGVSPVITGTTGTGLDDLVDVITQDPGLTNRISLGEINKGAEAADHMNQIIVQSLKATGLANDGRITASDVATLADFIKANHATVWIKAHGDDENNEETGFHLVQGDGGQTRLYADAAVNTVADGLYHLGFGHKNGRLLNEDGNSNASLSDVAFWLGTLLRDDLAAGTFDNPNNGPFSQGTTGTGLDDLVAMVAADEGLLARSTADKISTAAESADGLNQILVDAMRETGVANDGKLDAHDIKVMDAWIADNRLSELNDLNGVATSTTRTGFSLAEEWYSTSPLFGENGVRTVADAIYSIGYGVIYNDAIKTRDGKWNEKLDNIAAWMNDLVADDLAKGSFYAAEQAYADPASFADSIALQLDRPMIGNGQGGYENITHTSDVSLREATVAFNFTANDIPASGSATLFTKDARDYGDGGHTSLYFSNGELYARMQTKEKSHYVKVAERDQFQIGTSYSLAMILGETGLRVFINGEQVASNLDLTMSWVNNGEDIVVGGSGGSRPSGQLNGINSPFDGTIEEFTVYDRALTFGEIAGLNGVDSDVVPVGDPVTPPADDTPDTDDGTDDETPPTDDGNGDNDGGSTDNPSDDDDPDPADPMDDIMDGADDSGSLGTDGGSKTGSEGTDVYIAISGDNALSGEGGNDLLIGGFQDDVLEGGDGNDALIGDLLGAIFGGDDILDGGAGDDMLQGGRGADIFRFGTNDGDDIIAKFALDFGNVGSDAGFQTDPTGRDFVVGYDKISLNGFSSISEGNVLSSGALSSTADGTLFTAEGTSILLYGVELATLSETDFTFG